jgi:AraC-like DNA-binding protein
VSSTRGDVLVLLSGREAVARLHEALRAAPAGTSRPTVRRVERVAELRAALAEQRWGVIAVQTRDADFVPTDEVIREIRERQPDAVIVGYALKSELSSSILNFARAGVHELIVEGVDDAGFALRQAFSAAAKRATADRLLDDVAALVPSSFLPVMRYCLEHHGDAASVPDLARAFGVSRQALVTRARRAGLPAPRELLTWCRLLLAARMLAGGGASVDDVAIALHFPSGNGLRNALRRYAQLAMQDVRRDGVAPVLVAFADAIAAERATAPSALLT